MILGIAGLQDSGKTTLVELLVPKVVAAGFRVATVKHIAHDDLRVDAAGTDTARHRKAGAHTAVAASPSETVYFEKGGLTLDAITARLEARAEFDLILVEGFKKSLLPKIVVGAVEHGGEARWRWDGSKEGAAAIADAIVAELRGKA